MTSLPPTSDAPWQFTAPWGGREFVTDLDGPVHWARFGEKSDLPPLVCVHGLGGSLLNWALTAADWAAEREVYALDLHGFGMTPGDEKSATIRGNRRLLGRFLREVVGEPAVLVGNSMGGMISALHTAASPDDVTSLVLAGPALPLVVKRPDPMVVLQFGVFLTPVLGRRMVGRLLNSYPPEQSVQRTVDLVYADPERADPELMTQGAALIRAQRAGGHPRETAFLAAARSLMRWLGPGRDTYFDRLATIDRPVLLINGYEDRLVSIESALAAARRNPGWQAEFLPGVGHCPQMEVPAQFADLTRGFVDR